MKMSQIGEKKFLQSILPSLLISSDFVNGFGHDISILDLGLEKFITFKIDRASKPIMITNEWSSDWSIWGKLGVIANLSDHAAAGSTPKAAMISIITPRTTDHMNVEQIIKGCEKACIENNVAFVGGDTKEGKSTEVVVSTIGVSIHNSKLINANVEDSLFISGLLGGFLAANLIMFNKDLFDQDVISEAAFLLSNPQAQIKNSNLLYNLNIVYSATDLSDGLGDALLKFCNDKIGFEIEIEKIKFHPLAILVNKVLDIDLIKLALSVGDWAISYVIPKDKLGNIPLLDDFYCIGNFNSTGVLSYKTTDAISEILPLSINEQFVNRLEDQDNYLSNF